MSNLPILALELQNVTATPYVALTDAQWIYVGGSVTPLNPTISPDPLASGRIRSMSIACGKQQALNRVEAGTLNATLDNRDGAFNQGNIGSPFAGHTIPEQRVRVRAWYNRVNLGHALCNDTTAFQIAGASASAVTSSPSPRLANTTRFPFESLQLTGTGGTITVYDKYTGDQSVTPWNDAIGYPVVPGETVTAVASYQAGSTSRNCVTAIQFMTAAGANVGGAVSSAGVADNSSGWTDDSVTAVAPAGSAYAYVMHTIAGVASGEVHNIGCIGLWCGTDTTRDAIQFVPGQPTNWNGVGKMAIDRFYGYADGWTVTPKFNVDSTCHLQATDAFKRFNNYPTRDLFAMGILADAPTNYWRLKEAAGATLLTDVSGSNNPLEIIGSGPTLGVSDSPLVTTSKQCVSFASTGGRLQSINTITVGTGGLFLFNFWMKLNYTTMNSGWNTIISLVHSGDERSVQVAVATTGNAQGSLNFNVWNSAGTLTQALGLNGTTNICDGNWHWINLYSDGSNVAAIIDGATAPAAGPFALPTLTDLGSGLAYTLAIGDNINQAGSSPFYGGSLAEFAYFNGIDYLSGTIIPVDASTIHQLAWAQWSQTTGTPAGNVIENMLLMVVPPTWGGGIVGSSTWSLGVQLPNPSNTSAIGASIGQLPDIDSTSLLNVLNEKVAVTDWGMFFMRPDGQACYLSHAQLANNLGCTFSDNPSASGFGITVVPYTAIQIQVDEQLVVNDVIVTDSGASGGPGSNPSAEAISAASVDQFGLQKQSYTSYFGSTTFAMPSPASVGGFFEPPNCPNQLASNIVEIFDNVDPTYGTVGPIKLRIPNLEVVLHSSPAAAPTALSQTLGSQITVNHSAQGDPTTYSWQPILIHMEEQITPSTWHITFVSDTAY